MTRDRILDFTMNDALATFGVVAGGALTAVAGAWCTTFGQLALFLTFGA